MGYPTEHLDETERKLERVIAAARAVYYAAHWTPDRPVDKAALWTELRDACGFTPGKSPKPIPLAPGKICTRCGCAAGMSAGTGRAS